MEASIGRTLYPPFALYAAGSHLRFIYKYVNDPDVEIISTWKSQKGRRKVDVRFFCRVFIGRPRPVRAYRRVCICALIGWFGRMHCFGGLVRPGLLRCVRLVWTVVIFPGRPARVFCRWRNCTSTSSRRCCVCALKRRSRTSDV